VSRRAAFVDRDGTINELVRDRVSGLHESPLNVDEVALIPGAAAALGRLARAEWLLIGVSNQPAAAKGSASLAKLHAVQARVLELLADEGVIFDDFRICLHHPDGVVPELAGDCECRKPRPGMLLEAAHEHKVDLAASWMIGDTDGDVLAGAAAGCRTALIVIPGSAHKRTPGARPDAEVDSLAAAAEWILSSKGVN
jgi:D-glycero-D-manno-heptose 1,7-bisphosphate phosphatase